MQQEINKIPVAKGQTIFDIAIQQYGSIEGVKQILEDNPEVKTYNSNLYPGQLLFINGEIISQDVVDYYKTNNITPATGSYSGGSFNSGFNNGFKK